MPHSACVAGTDTACRKAFEQMLCWEWEYPGYGEVHHLTVLSFHVQHPSLYSREALREGVRLLQAFVEQGLRPEEAVRRGMRHVRSGAREFTITSRADSAGAYRFPITWTMLAQDVIDNGAERYRESVRAWAGSILEALRLSGNFDDQLP